MKKDINNITDIDLKMSIMESLKNIATSYNKKYYGINLCLYMPGLEPLNLLEKEPEELLGDLNDNIILMNTKELAIDYNQFKHFFGFTKEELQGIAINIKFCIDLEEYYEGLIMNYGLVSLENVRKYKKEIINRISKSMLIAYSYELTTLLLDFANYNTIDENRETGEWGVSTPQHLSQYFRIMSKDNKECLCTIADAINSSIEQEEILSQKRR